MPKLPYRQAARLVAAGPTCPGLLDTIPPFAFVNGNAQIDNVVFRDFLTVPLPGLICYDELDGLQHSLVLRIVAISDTNEVVPVLLHQFFRTRLAWLYDAFDFHDFPWSFTKAEIADAMSP